MSLRLGFLTSPCWSQHQIFTQCFLHSKPLIVKLNLLKLQETNLCLHFFLCLQCSVMPFPPLKKIQWKKMRWPSNLLNVTKVELRIERHQSEILIHHLSYIHSQFPQRVKRHQSKYLPRTEIKGVCHCQWNWSSNAHFAIPSLGQVYFCNELKIPLYKNIIHVYGKRQNVLAPKLTNCFLKDGMFLSLTRELVWRKKKKKKSWRLRTQCCISTWQFV